MTSQNQLSPGCLILLLPKMQRIVVDRFRRRRDVEGHLQVLQRSHPTRTYIIIFDPSEINSYEEHL
ncbi:hypothetical protein ACKFKF_19685 [Phormidesmis sp. 146-12]